MLDYHRIYKLPESDLPPTNTDNPGWFEGFQSLGHSVIICYHPFFMVGKYSFFMVNLHLFAAQIWPVPCQAVAVQDEGAITVKEEHRPAALGGLGYPFVKSPQTRDDPLLPNPKILFL